MTRRYSFWIALAVAAGLPAAVPAGDPKPAEPALVVQLKPVEGLLADLKYFAGLVNPADQAAQLDGVIQAWAGSGGLAGTGVDPRRPFLAYAIAGPNGTDSPFAL